MKSYHLILLFCIHAGLFAQTAQDYLRDGFKLFQQEKYKYALQKAKAGIALDSTELELHSLALESMYRQNMRAEGLAWYLRHKKLYATHFGTNFLGGLLYLSHPIEAQPALEAFETALEMAPNDTLFHYVLFFRATAKSFLRDFEGAAIDFRNCLKFNPSHIDAMINLSAVEDDLGNMEESKALLNKIIELQPDNIGALANIGFRLQQDSAWEASNTFYNRVLELNPNEPLGYSNRSYNRMMLGDLKGAMKDIKKSIELLPENSWAYRNQGLIYLRMKKGKEACASFEEGLRRGFTARYGPELEQLHKEHCR